MMASMPSWSQHLRRRTVQLRLPHFTRASTFSSKSRLPERWKTHVRLLKRRTKQIGWRRQVSASGSIQILLGAARGAGRATGRASFY